MIFRPTMRARAFHSAFALAGLLAACEQGRGDVCQVDSDCQAPLLCVERTHQCQPLGTGDDADAAPPGEPPLPPDAAPSEIDAAPEFDAAPPIDAAR